MHCHLPIGNMHLYQIELSSCWCPSMLAWVGFGTSKMLPRWDVFEKSLSRFLSTLFKTPCNPSWNHRDLKAILMLAFRGLVFGHIWMAPVSQVALSQWQLLPIFRKQEKYFLITGSSVVFALFAVLWLVEESNCRQITALTTHCHVSVPKHVAFIHDKECMQAAMPMCTGFGSA